MLVEVTHNSSICSDEGLTLETSAFQSLYGGQFTLSAPLINQIFMLETNPQLKSKNYARQMVITSLQGVLFIFNCFPKD